MGNKNGSRVEVVEALVQGALVGMQQVASQVQPTNDEVISAYFTLIKRGIIGGIAISEDKPKTRAAMQQTLLVILAEVTSDTLN